MNTLIKLKSIDRHLLLFPGLFFLLGAGGIAATNFPGTALINESDESRPVIFSSPLPPLPTPVRETPAPIPSVAGTNSHPSSIDPGCVAGFPAYLLRTPAPPPFYRPDIFLNAKMDKPIGDKTVEAMPGANIRARFSSGERAGTTQTETAFMEKESWILSCPKESFSIQLMGSDRLKDLMAFADSRKLNGKIAFFRKRHLNGDWYVLIYGIFSCKRQAREALSNLPPSYKTASPWIRSFSEIQTEIRALAADKVTLADKTGLSIPTGGKDP